MSEVTPIRRGRLEKLEALRGFAAAYVVLSHISNVYLGNPTWLLPIRFGQTAVILFFILSGFVICYSTGLVGRGESPPGGFRDYFIKRFRRIYPLFVCAMAAGYLGDCAKEGKWIVPDWAQLVGNLLMLQDAKGFRPGVWFDAFHNNPLWSLAYEWWYYMLFYPLLVWNVPWWVKKYVVFGLGMAGLVSCMVWPQGPAMYLLLMPAWWSGVELAREYQETGEITLERQAASIIYLGAMTAVFVMWWQLPEYHAPGTEQFEKGEVQHFGAAFLLLFGGILWRGMGWRGFRMTFGWFTAIAPISYAIYVFHMPVLVALLASPLKNLSGVAGQAVFVAAVLGVVVVLSWLTEIKLQGVINRWTNGLLRGRRAAVQPTGAG